jgi:hypothetical protein
MSHSLAKIVVGSLSAATLAAALAGCAQTIVEGSFPERCRAVLEQPDGSWLVRRPIVFGRGIRVEAGATLHKGEVVNGVDLGAVLQRTCRDPSLNAPRTAVRF